MKKYETNFNSALEVSSKFTGTPFTPVNSTLERLLPGNIENYINLFLTKHYPDEAVERCLHIHMLLKQYLEQNLPNKFHLTFGYVKSGEETYFKFGEKEIKSWVNEPIFKQKEEYHCWLTLESMEIIDISISRTLTKKKERLINKWQTIEMHADELQNDVTYQPVFVGENLAKLTGLLSIHEEKQKFPIESKDVVKDKSKGFGYYILKVCEEMFGKGLLPKKKEIKILENIDAEYLSFIKKYAHVDIDLENIHMQQMVHIAHTEAESFIEKNIETNILTQKSIDTYIDKINIAKDNLNISIDTYISIIFSIVLFLIQNKTSKRNEQITHDKLKKIDDDMKEVKLLLKETIKQKQSNNAFNADPRERAFFQ